MAVKQDFSLEVTSKSKLIKGDLDEFESIFNTVAAFVLMTDVAKKLGIKKVVVDFSSTKV